MTEFFQYFSTIFQSTVFILSSFVFIAFVVPVLLKKRLTRDKLGSIVMTIGVLGTFLGVTVALYHFDVANIKESLPKLLGGLKTAFVTSIAGMIAAIILKVFPNIYGSFASDHSNEAKTQVEQMIEALSAIKEGIVGSEEGSLVAQIKLLRSEQIEQFKAMRTSFESFAERMVADSTQSLIDMLQEVIRDFNAKINEQFGENFKQLNEAVGKMLDWQKEYAARIERMTEQFNLASESISTSEQNLARMTDHADRYTQSAQKLDELLEVSFKSLQALERVAERAPEVLPSLEEALVDMTERLTDTVSTNLAQIEKQAQDFELKVELTLKNNQQMIEDQRRALQDQQNQLGEMSEEMREHYQTLFRQFEQQQQQFHESQAERIEAQLVEFDQLLQKELENSLTTFGSQLASISSKFAQDYEPLADLLANMDRQVKQGMRRVNG